MGKLKSPEKNQIAPERNVNDISPTVQATMLRIKIREIKIVKKLEFLCLVFCCCTRFSFAIKMHIFTILR
jgi:hypothetical protein